MSAAFDDATPAQLQCLMQQQPMCWIVPSCDPGAAILMPVVLETDTAGMVQSLLGHLPRRAPATAKLGADGRATFLCLGPNGYISPVMAGRSDWAPTWNFASVKFEGHVVIDDTLTRGSVEAIVQAMEGEAGWSMDHLGSRAETLLGEIIGFRAGLQTVVPRLKLGQDERRDTFDAIVDALGDSRLAEWMRGAAK